MGFLDSLKKAVGGGGKAPETVKGPSRTLRDAGIDPSGLDLKIGGDGSITVSGRVASQEQCDRICKVLEDMPNISGVNNRMNVGEPEPEPEPAPEPVPEPEPATAPTPEATAETPAGRTYTVQAGDSLWKIATEMYGSGAKYMTIFEANRDQLDNPDKIFPGQELKIPEPED